MLSLTHVHCLLSPPSLALTHVLHELHDSCKTVTAPLSLPQICSLPPSNLLSLSLSLKSATSIPPHPLPLALEYYTATIRYPLPLPLEYFRFGSTFLLNW